MDYFLGKGGSFRYNSRLQKFLLGSSGQVEGFQLADGSTVTGDLYVSAMPGNSKPLPALTCLEELLQSFSNYLAQRLTRYGAAHVAFRGQRS